MGWCWPCTGAKENEHEQPSAPTEGRSPPPGLVSLRAEAGPLALQVVLNAKCWLGGPSCPSAWP